MPCISPETLRSIIRGEISFRKCPDCDGETLVFWEEFKGNDEQISMSASAYYNAGGASNMERILCRQTCECCAGLGYVSNDIVIRCN